MSKPNPASDSVREFCTDLAREAVSLNIPSAVTSQDVLEKLDWRVARDWFVERSRTSTPSTIAMECLESLSENDLIDLFAVAFSADPPNKYVTRVISQAVKRHVASSLAARANALFDEVVPDEPRPITWRVTA